MRHTVAAALLALAALGAADAFFYVPGVRPTDYVNVQQVDLMVNKITSVKTQLPYDYYSLPVCKPDSVAEASESIGQILQGERIKNSDYQLHVNYPRNNCAVLCRKKYGEDDKKKFMDKIEDEYMVHWMVDNLPAGYRTVSPEDPEVESFDRGFPLGFPLDNPSGSTDLVLNNHVHIIVSLHRVEYAEGAGEASHDDSEDKYRIVGFEVVPYSVQHTYKGGESAWVQNDNFPAQQHGAPLHPNLLTCEKRIRNQADLEMLRINTPGTSEVIWTYEVEWRYSEVEWSHRWDVYLEGSMMDDEIHWFSIINSLMIVLFLSAMIGMILVRALYRDIARYNAQHTSEEAEEESGWKLVHGDVLRPPVGSFGPMVLSVFVGAGFQMLTTTFGVLVLAVLGFLSPANRGGLIQSLLLLFIFMGIFSGYLSARLYKLFQGKAWKRNTLLSGICFPGAVFGTAFVVNFFVWGEGSSSAIPFTTMLAIGLLWFGISVPLVVVGAYFGFKKEVMAGPVRVNLVPRHIPEQPWYLLPVPSILIGGILPFGAVFIELYFVLSSIWLAQVYYAFHFTAVVMLITVVTCAEIAIVMAYFQLCAEDYNWWWRSFLTPGASAMYLFLYSIIYYMTRLNMSKFVSGVVYFSYMSVISFAFFLLTGSIGFVSTLLFVRKIYSTIKVD